MLEIIFVIILLMLVPAISQWLFWYLINVFNKITGRR